MRSTTSRRLVALIAAVAAFAAIGVGSASAAMPASDPTGYKALNKTAYAQVFNVTINEIGRAHV